MDLSTIIARRRTDQEQKTLQAQQSQNLIDPSKINTTEREAGFYKSIILDLVSVLSAAAFGFSYYRYLSGGLSVWFVLAGLTFFAVFSVLQVFLAKNDKRAILVIFLQVAALFVFFRQDNFWILITMTLVMLVMLLWGYLSARSRLKNSIQIPFFGASDSMLSKFTTGALLFMILSYVPQLGGNPLVVSQQDFRTFFDWTSAFVNRYYPTVPLNGSFGSFSQDFAKTELEQNPSFENLNASEQQLEVQQASTQLTNSLPQSSSTPIASSTPTSDAFYNVLNGALSAWQSQSSGWFDVGWATVLFIGLRTLGILFVFFGQFMSLILYEIFLASGFMKVSEETTKKEIIHY